MSTLQPPRARPPALLALFWTALAVASAPALGACGAPAGAVDPARSAATAFARDLAAGEFGAGCALLTDAAADALEKQGTGCASALAESGLAESSLADPGQLRGVDVWGRAALARFSDDEIFLALVDGDWRVAAAGCRVTGKGPADCQVGGD